MKPQILSDLPNQLQSERLVDSEKKTKKNFHWCREISAAVNWGKLNWSEYWIQPQIMVQSTSQQGTIR